MSFSSKDAFKLIFELQKNQPWVANKFDTLEKLLFRECLDDQHRRLIVELVNNFEYLSNDKFSSLLTELTEDIVTDPDLSDDTTQIVAMAADSRADSSQYILYGLKPILEKMEWRKYQHVNTFGAAYRTYKKSKDHKNIVLIDEFVGSGETLVGRVREIERTFSNNQIDDYSIKVKVLIATRQGLDMAKSKGIDITSRITLKKGITDYYPKELVSQMIKLMLELESILLESYDDRELPSLGYRGTESLYCRDDGNTPNSVFPIFWWPFYKNGEPRCTLLTRAMGDA